MDFHPTKYRFWPVNYLASRTEDARSIYSNRELKNTRIYNESSITVFSLWFTFSKITEKNDSFLLLEGISGYNRELIQYT